MTASTAVATTKPTAFEVELQNYEPQIAAALPQHISVERFKRTIITALNANPELWHADRRSLFTSCVRAAQDGLFPDGREAALVIFNTKNRKTGEWVKMVQYMPMVAGIIKRMRNSGDVAAVDTQVVHEHDAFDYELGDSPHIHHKPTLGDPGKPIAAYAIIKLTNGEVLREVMSTSEIEKVRAVSRAKDDGPWVSWWTEMARKSVLRRCAKRAPVSSDLDAILRREDERDLTEGRGEQQPIVSIPARPTRASFDPPAEEHAKAFSIVNADGETREYEDPGAAADALTKALDEAAKSQGQKGLDGVWESNGVTVGAIREAEPELADALHQHFTEASNALSDAAKPEGEAKKTDAPTADAKAPPSPLKHAKAPWPPLVDYLAKQIEAMTGDDLREFLGPDAPYAAELDFIGTNRKPDWARLMAIADAKKPQQAAE